MINRKRGEGCVAILLRIALSLGKHTGSLLRVYVFLSALLVFWLTKTRVYDTIILWSLRISFSEKHAEKTVAPCVMAVFLVYA